jgi:large subunit ribosomal protein L7/L12
MHRSGTSIGSGSSSSSSSGITLRIAPAHYPRHVSTATATSPSSSEDNNLPASLSSPRLQGLYDRIIQLPEADVNILGALVIQVLGKQIFPGEFGGGGAMALGAGAKATEEAIPEVVKTIFDLKLVGFDAAAKIKVIKEVRAIAGLGLKEAKELVESAPKVIQKGLKQDKADELKALLEAVGAQVEII